MAGHFLKGLVLLLILGLGMTSSYIIDDPNPSDKEMETMEDMGDEMTKLDEMSAKHVDKEQAEDLVVRQVNLEGLYKQLIDECWLEAIKRFAKQAVLDKNKANEGALRKFYQNLQHGGKSIVDDDTWLAAKQSESCSACIVKKLCANQAVLNELGVSNLAPKEKEAQCKLKLFEEASKFHSEEEDIKCNADARFRTADGTCNNLDNPVFGSAGSQFRRLVPNAYGDCVSTLRLAKNGEELPNARDVSRIVHGSNADRTNPDSPTLSHLAMNWGQFMDHDITLAQAQGINCEEPTDNPECVNIHVPEDDVTFRERGVEFMEMEREEPHKPAEKCKLIPREHSNSITAYIDASNVYGSSEEEEEDLRAPGGLMRVMKHPHGCPLMNLLPAAHADVPCVSKDPNRPCFLAGDERVNENQGLMSVHTLFVRAHNRIATFFGRMTGWRDERIYQESRRIVGAYLQIITYNEWLPEILSPRRINENGLRLLRGTQFFDGYDPDLNPQMSQVFYTAAYRFGHSLVQEEFSRLTQDGFEHKCGKDSKKEFLPIPVLDFGNPIYLYEKCQGGIDALWRGLMKDPAAKIDGRFSSSVQENLFRGPGDLSDLVALNIQRSREHGVPGYTVYRNRDSCKISPKVQSFDDLEKAGFDPEDIENLKSQYKSVHDIDVFVGAMLEPNEEGGRIGPTFGCIIAEQFGLLRRGDRFWHENKPDPAKNTDNTAFTPCQLRELRKIRISKILCNNSDDIPALVKFAFLQSDIRVDCDKLPEPNLNVFRPGFKCPVAVSSDSPVSADQHLDDEL